MAYKFKISLFCLSVLLTLNTAVLISSERPKALVNYDQFGNYAILVDKSECSVNVYGYTDNWKLLKKFGCETGKKDGDKHYEGDLKTPTGVYLFSNAWTDKQLVKSYGRAASAIYGSGAVELNYPNNLDKYIHKKTGYGIWLHGTDKGLPEKTRGCVQTKNIDLLSLSQYITLNKTPIIIEENLKFITENEAKKQQQTIETFLDEWRLSWQNGDVKNYFSHYDKDFKTKKFNLKRWLAYKNNLFKYNKQRSVDISDVSVFYAKNLYHVRFKQNYSSTNANDVGYKELYLKKTKGDLFKIIGEFWKPIKNLNEPKLLSLAKLNKTKL